MIPLQKVVHRLFVILNVLRICGYSFELEIAKKFGMTTFQLFAVGS